MTRITGGTKTISLYWGQNGGFGSLKITGDGTYGYLAFLVDNPTFANQINIGDTIVITQAGNPYPSANVIGLYDTFSDAVVSDPNLDWNGIKGIKLDNAFGISGFSAATNIDGFVVTQRKGLRITGGFKISDAPRGNPTTQGIPFALLNSMPTGVIPTVSLYKSGTGIATVWQAVNSALYPTPAGYTFSNNTQVYDYGAYVSGIDSYTVIASGANESFSMARFTPATQIGNKTMYSFVLVNSSGVPEWDAIGLCTNGVNLTDFIGGTTASIGVYDNGAVYFGEYISGSANGPTFESNGTVVDLLVNNQSQQMWYSVNGSAWIGNYTPTI